MHDSFAFFQNQTLPVADATDLSRARQLLRRRAGIVLGEHKRDMVMRTLGLRTQQLRQPSVRAYLDHLDANPEAAEWDRFVSAFTINHTAFFRERHHFQILREFLRGRTGSVAIWCCAASTGEEPYSLAMTLHDACEGTHRGISVLATDVDRFALEQARRGVYTLDRVKPVPQVFLQRYFQRGQGSQAGLARVKPVIRDLVHFEALNLVAPSWPIRQVFDAIFCRNTMIYFDKPTQVRILERFVPLLKPGGLMFAGHSENFTYLTDALRLRGQTVYSVA